MCNDRYAAADTKITATYIDERIETRKRLGTGVGLDRHPLADSDDEWCLGDAGHACGHDRVFDAEAVSESGFH